MTTTPARQASTLTDLDWARLRPVLGSLSGTGAVPPPARIATVDELAQWLERLAVRQADSDRLSEIRLADIMETRADLAAVGRVLKRITG